MLKRFPLVGLVLLSSCVLGRQAVNEPIEVEAVRSLQPGVSKAGDVVAKLGAPTEVVQLGRRTAYRYDATSTRTTGLLLLVVGLFGQDTRSDRVWVFFDEDDVLTHVGSTFATHRTQYGGPWRDLHDVDRNAALDANRAGLSR
jgi:hypothetical protein